MVSASPTHASPRTGIAVVPASLGSAGDAVVALAAEVRGQALRPLSADVVGNAHCCEALAAASRLVGRALEASSGSLEEMSGALRSAAGVYRLADLMAFMPEGR